MSMSWHLESTMGACSTLVIYSLFKLKCEGREEGEKEAQGEAREARNYAMGENI